MFKCSRYITRVFALAFAMLILQSGLSIAQVTVSLPTATGQLGSTVALPVTVGSLTGQNVYSYQFTVTFDSSIVKIASVTASGTISSAMQISSNVISGDTLKVAAAGTSALSGSGTLLNINAQLVKVGTSALTFQAFQFNEGTPASSLQNGSIGVPTLAVAVAADTGRVGSPVTIPLTTNDLTGQNVYSFQFSVAYDPTILTGVGYSTTGTLSSGMQVSSNVVHGTTLDTLKIAAAGTSALSGQGVLINLTGQIGKAGTSALTVSGFQYNEGSPSAGAVSGSVTGVTNHRPVFTAMSAKTVAQTDTLTFTVLATDSDNDSLTYTATGLPQGASFNAATRVFTWAPSYAQLGPFSVMFKATDPYGAYDSLTVAITVTVKYTQPSIVNHTPSTLSKVQIGSAVTFSVTAKNANPSDTLTYAWSVNGTVQKTGHDSTFTTTLSDSGNAVVKVVVTDLGGLTDNYTWNFVVTGVNTPIGLPKDFALNQNYPNPFNPTTVISFDVPKMASVKIVVYDILGREVRTLLNQNMAAGRYTATWNGLNDYGQQVSTGVYFYRMDAGNFVSMKKMLLLK